MCSSDLGVQDKSQAHTALEEGCERLPDGRIVPAAEAGKAFRFYDVWHEYLRNRCGIDFVKVDGQSAISLFHAGTLKTVARDGQKWWQGGLRGCVKVGFLSFY